MTAAPAAADARRHWVPQTRTLLIGGRDVEPEGETWQVLNPATEDVIAEVGGASLDQVDAAVAAARAAFPGWAALRGDQRSQHLHRLADALEDAADDLLPSIVNEVGTPVALAAYLQVRMAVEEHLRWAAEAAKTDRTVHLGGYDRPHPTMSDVVHEPAGVVAAITGYNYPLNLAVFKFGAALAAGCTVVLLPSPRTPLTTLFLGALVERAGLPPGVMNIVVGGTDVGVRLSSHPGVDRVSFTGSDGVGARIGHGGRIQLGLEPGAGAPGRAYLGGQGGCHAVGEPPDQVPGLCPEEAVTAVAGGGVRRPGVRGARAGDQGPGGDGGRRAGDERTARRGGEGPRHGRPG